MIKTILVGTDGSSYGDTACAYAVELATRLKARLTGLHVLDARLLEGPLLADISGWLGAEPFSAQLAQFRELMEKKGEVVLQAFRARCDEAGLTAEVLSKTGLPARVILEEETRAELVVLGQRGEHAELTGELAGSTVERVVRHSLKPCLVTPAAHRPIGKILVGYDGSGHASRALREAVELAAAISAPLVILSVAENGEEGRARACAEDAMKVARAHECVAAELVVHGDPAEQILAKAADLGCSLIVVGAYGHGRIREMILGSTTHLLIARTTLPLLMVR